MNPRGPRDEDVLLSSTSLFSPRQLPFLPPLHTIRHESPTTFHSCPLATTAAKIFDLSESNWTLTSPGNESIVGIEGKLPSQAHLDLYAAGVIPDPYFGLNDFDLRWVARSNWSYSTSVDGL